MATINKDIAEEIIAAEGEFEGDPTAQMVLKYKNDWGGQSYAVVYSPKDLGRYLNSHNVDELQILWTRKTPTRKSPQVTNAAHPVTNAVHAGEEDRDRPTMPPWWKR